MKTCTKCSFEQPLENFYKRGNGKLRNECKSCFNLQASERSKTSSYKARKQKWAQTPSAKQGKKDSWLIKYWPNLTGKEARKEYNRLFVQQNGCCKTCNLHQSQLNKVLVVDHDHHTNVVRGLLCEQCNLLLGAYEKILRTDLITAFDIYLNRTKIKLIVNE